ncbi:MAG: hypothetical protein J0L83_14570 [Chitinophagales bacterium]|nr:hypothetical protein [Chitinophagales bacterium]
MKKLLILLLFSYSIANAQLPTWVIGNQINVGPRDTSNNATLKLFINGRTTGKYLKNSGWGNSSFGNIESGDVPWGGGFTLYDARYVILQRFLDSIAAVRASFNSINLSWNNITGKPTAFPTIWDSVKNKPSLLLAANNLADVTNVGTARTNLNVYSKTEADARYLQSFTETDPTVYAWAKAATKPAYAVAEITGLQTALDGKQNVLGFTPVPDTRTINGAPLSANITLTKTDVGLSNVPNTDATNPANISQSSSYRFVTDTEKSTWNAKQNALGYTPENLANKGQANGYADLDANGKIPAARIDFTQTGQTFVVASQSAMLAVSGANVGAMAIRTDQSRTYVLIATPASTLGNWVQLLSPDAPVQSVNGQTGNVNLTTTNISEAANLYFTDARARAALSAGAGITYNSTTGQISSTITQYTDAMARASLSAGAGISYNSTTGQISFNNTAGYITGINSSMVTTALGYTPYNATNPAGYITASALSSYMPFSGGTMTGHLNMGGWNISGVTTISGTQAAFSGVIDAWGATFQRPIYIAGQTGNHAISTGGSGGDYGSIGYNVSYTTTTGAYNYRVGDFASFIRFQSGGFQFFTAPTGTGGASMTPVNRYTMDVNGNNSWSGNGVFGGSVQINSRNYLYLGNTANTLYPSIRNMDTDGIGIYTNAGSALLEASAASGISTNGRAFAAGAGSFSTLSASSSVTGRWFNILEASANRGGLYTYNVISGSGTDYSVGVFSEGDMFFATGGSATKKVTISSTGLLSGQSATFSGRMNADDYEMGSWRILDWAGVTAQIGGINASNWQQIDFYTNGTLRGTFSNTEFTSTLPAIINGGTAMTGGWNRTVQLTANFPSIVFNSSSQKWAGISFDYSSNFVIRMNATSSDVFGSGYSALLINNSTGAATFNFTVSATRFFATSDIRLKTVFSEFKSADGINPIIYSFKNEFKPSWGYSAQQVQKEMSFAVTEGDDGYLRVDYQQVHTYKIMQLEKRIAELERRVNNGLPEKFPFVDGDSKKVLLKNDHQ